MKTMIRGLVAVLALMTLPIHAADDPSIQGKTRKGVQKAMQRHIQQMQIDGTYMIYDPVEDKVLELTLAELHDGIVRKGEYFVSCADFVDNQGQKVDLDFLVLPRGNGFQAVQALVHKVGGKKRPYHLDH